MDDDTDRRPQRTDFIRTLAWLMRERGFTQRGFVAEVGLSSHTEISRWKTLAYEPRPETVFAIERVLSVPSGTLSRTLGYLPLDARDGATPGSFDEALRTHPFLPAEAKDIIRYIVERHDPTREG